MWTRHGDLRGPGRSSAAPYARGIVRRWNGWIEEGAAPPRVADEARRLLEAELGPGRPQPDANLGAVAAALPPSAFADDAAGRLSLDGPDRIRHARGQSLPDWIALRSGRLGRVPDAVARPADSTAVRELFDLARDRGAVLMPYGGGERTTPRARRARGRRWCAAGTAA